MLENVANYLRKNIDHIVAAANNEESSYTELVKHLVMMNKPTFRDEDLKAMGIDEK
jgi:hypothetical protein